MADQDRPAVARGEVNVDFGGGATGKVNASQNVPLEQVMGIAAAIWAEVKRSGVAPDDHEGNDRLLKDLQVAHKDFSVSYPIPFRWMVQTREYEPRAFEKFLREEVKTMYKDRKEFMKAQGEYLVILYKVRNPRAGVRQITRYRKAIGESLTKDDEVFTEARDEAEKEVHRLDEDVDKERRQRLLAYLTRLKAEREAGTT